MATIIKGLLAQDLPWALVFVGMLISIVVELCGIRSLSFAVGVYLPLSTTAPIFVGGALKGVADYLSRRRGEEPSDSELGPGNLFATGLVAGGALAGVIVAIFSASDTSAEWLAKLSAEEPLRHALGPNGYDIVGVVGFALMCAVLFKVARKKFSE